ncbi:MAG: SGNH/GDSL hydrolase family protein [Nibricoccus sp.]
MLFVAAACLTVVSYAGQPAKHAPFSKVVVFGDSLSDTGNLFAATGGAIPPSPAYVNGHFSNGLVWVEYLADRLGMAMDNYAFGGACTGRDSYVSFKYGIPGLPGLQDEIVMFAAEAGGRADPRALYIVQAGANDVFLWAESGMPTPLADFAAQVAGNISTAVKRLRLMGARDILVVDIADIGLTPYGLASGYSTLLSGITETLNAAVAAKLRGSRHCPGPQADVFSMFTTLRAIAAAPAEFGFADSTNPYLEVLAGDPDSFLFWDDVHPTTAGQGVLADFAYERLEQLYPRLRHGKCR